MIALRVLNIINSFAVGGAENLLQEMAKIMKSKGLDIEILLLTKENDYYSMELKKNGIIVKWTGINDIYSFKQIIEIKRFLEKNDYDLVHTHLFPAQYWYVLAKSLSTKRTIPSITTEHNTFNRRRNYPLFKLVDSIIYKQYHKIACISKATEKTLHNWVPVIQDKTITIHNGINIEKFNFIEPYHPSEIVSGLDERNQIILMVARMDEQKDHETVIYATQYLPDDMHILFVGDGPKRKKYEDLVNKMDLKNRIHFLGFRHDVPKLMKSAHVFVLSSHWEGFGLVAIEAMAAGLPIIVSDVPGLRDVVGNAGWLFQKGNSNELAKKIIKLLNSKKETDKLKEKGLQRARVFSIENTVQQYINLYKSVCCDYR